MGLGLEVRRSAQKAPRMAPRISSPGSRSASLRALCDADGAPSGNTVAFCDKAAAQSAIDGTPRPL